MTLQTGHIACMQRLNMKKQLCCLEPSQAHFLSEKKLRMPSCIDMDSSGPCGQTQQRSAPLLSLSGGNFAESISGINSKLESPLGCSNRKLLQTSAINSSTASFSDGQLMGSQERAAFSVTTSAKLVEENLKAQPTISNLSGEVTKIRFNEKFAEVAENNVKIPDSDDVGRVCEHIRKRKRVLDSVESIKYWYSKVKKLNMQIEEKLSILHGMLGRQVGNPLGEGRCLAPNLQCIPYPMLDGFCKRRKSHDEVLEKHFCESDGQKKTEFFLTEVLEDAIDLETLVGFEDVAFGDSMKLLALDNAANEESYRMAMEVPLSPTLPNIDLHGVGNFDVDNSEAYEGLLTDKENLMGISNLPISRHEELKFPVENELGSSHENIPEYCVVFPDMRDCNTVYRIFCAAKTCIARCCLLSQTEWVVPKILLALKMEENLLLV